MLQPQSIDIQVFACRVIFHDLLSSTVFFLQNYLFQKNLSGIPFECQTVNRPYSFYKLIYGNIFSDLGSGGREKEKSSENDQLTGHFQSCFLFFRVFFF